MAVDVLIGQLNIMEEIANDLVISLPEHSPFNSFDFHPMPQEVVLPRDSVGLRRIDNDAIHIENKSKLIVMHLFHPNNGQRMHPRAVVQSV